MLGGSGCGPAGKPGAAARAGRAQLNSSGNKQGRAAHLVRRTFADLTSTAVHTKAMLEVVKTRPFRMCHHMATSDVPQQ